jgi:DNA-binding GntR family transcriptional regulator
MSSVFGDQPVFSSVRQQLTDRIKDAIVEMRLHPGDRLTEREIVEWSGASRATVREALRELEALRLVAILPGRGAVVASLSLEEAEQLYEIRAALEGIVGRKCAERATPEQIIAIRQSFSEMARTVSSPPKLALRAKSQFYDALFAGAGNGPIRDVLMGLQARITVFRSISMSQPGRAQHMISELRAIVDAIEARDPKSAEEACISHVRSASKVVIAALQAEHDKARPS